MLQSFFYMTTKEHSTLAVIPIWKKFLMKN